MPERHLRHPGAHKTTGSQGVRKAVIETSRKPTITVVKLDHLGQETWRYQGTILKQAPHEIILEAFFDHDEIWIDEIILCRGDRFIEYYYDNRWYNVFEVHAREDGRFKGWYCNISSPAEITERHIKYRDLALDLLVYPDGRQVILDEEEFSLLTLDPKLRAGAQGALTELQNAFNQKVGQRTDGTVDHRPILFNYIDSEPIE